MSPDDQQRVRDIGRRAWSHAARGLQPLLTQDEIANLSIAKGTLLPEERQVINNHIVATIPMPESLPFPKHLRKVREYAAGHHERMDGRSCPRGLRREQMSDALAILERMKQDNHIDPDLHEVFMREKVYLWSTPAVCRPREQIDVT